MSAWNLILISAQIGALTGLGQEHNDVLCEALGLGEGAELLPHLRPRRLAPTWAGRQRALSALPPTRGAPTRQAGSPEGGRVL